MYNLVLPCSEFTARGADDLVRGIDELNLQGLTSLAGLLMMGPSPLTNLCDIKYTLHSHASEYSG